MQVVVSVLLSGWMALLLAEWGIFRLWLLLALVLLFCGACGIAIMRRGDRWRSQPADRRPIRRSDVLLAVIGLGFALLVARPFEVIRGGLDAGVYTLTGFAIARTGSIVQYDPLVADISARAEAGDVDAQHVRNQLLVGGHPERSLASKLRAAGFGITPPDLAHGRVVPQFFHLWPSWIAVWTAAGTPYTGLLATGAAALLGVLVLGLLGRKLAGPWVGVFAAAFLALSTPQVWFGRMPTSEALAQALILIGLWSYSHFAEAPEGRAGSWWGLLTGAAFGQLALTRIDSFWAVGPTLALLAFIALTRRWRSGYTALAATLLALLVHTLLHTLVIARAYFFDTAYARIQDWALTAYAALPFLTETLRSVYYTRNNSKLGDPLRLVAEIAAVALALGIMIMLWWRPGPLLRADAFIRRQQRPLLLLWGAVLLLGAAYAYLVRPHLINAEVLRQPLGSDQSLQLQGYVGAPITLPEGFDNLKIAQNQANMVRLGWYLSPLGVLLGVWGAVRWWLRGLDRRSWLLLVMATAYTVFYIRLLYATDDATYIYILRRYVPLVFPAWMLAISYALFGSSRRWAGGRWQRLQPLTWLVRCGVATLLLLFFAWTGRNVYRHVEYGGAFPQFQALAAQLQPDDVVLVRTAMERDQADIPAAPLTYLYGRNALVWKGSEPQAYGQALSGQIARWRGEGRETYLLLGASSGDWQLPGWGVVPVTDWSWHYREYEQPTDHKPSQAGPEQSLTLRLYRVTPANQAQRPSAITPLDTALQRSGMYRVEASTEGPVAWTAATAVIELPGPGRDLTLELGSGTRPASLGPTPACVSIAPISPEGVGSPWVQVGCQTVGAVRQSFNWSLPAKFAEAPLLVRLETSPWVPSQTPPTPGDPPSQDNRTLGLRFWSATRAK